jgi:hypothetical protein
MPERHSIIELKIAHYRAMLKSDLCDEKRAQVKRWLAERLADLDPTAGAKQPAGDHAGMRAEQIMERLDRIDDELNAGPRRNRHIVTSQGEFLDDFENSVEADDWKVRRAKLVNERCELNDEWQRVTGSTEN